MSNDKTKKPKLIPLERLGQAAECLRALAHPARLRMLQMLLQDDFTVGELAEACEIQSHVASEHLRRLKHCGLFKARREGRKTYYQVADPHLSELLRCIEGRFG